MANNYVQATVFPEDIPSNAITEEEKQVLEYSGFTVYDDHQHIYIVVEENFLLDESPEFIEDETKEITAEDVFNRILSRVAEIDEIVIAGAYTCSKMRSGEFGGFIYRFTRDKLQFADTEVLLEMMRKGII